MKLIKMILVVALGGFLVTGCGHEIISCDELGPGEVGRILNSYRESPKNRSSQFVPIRSKPSGAMVLIDGKETGTTPFDLKLQRGSYEYVVELVKKGYRKETVRVKAKLYLLKAGVYSMEMNNKGWYYQYEPIGVNVTLNKE